MFIYHASDIEVAAFAALHLIVINHDPLALLPDRFCSMAARGFSCRDRVEEDPQWGTVLPVCLWQPLACKRQQLLQLLLGCHNWVRLHEHIKFNDTLV